MPALFWGFVAIVVLVLGLALVALRPQPKTRGGLEAHGDGAEVNGLWWATDVGSGDCGDGGGDGGCGD